MAFTLEQENALLNLLNEKRTTLSELPAVADINEDDLFLTRQGISDKSVTAAVIRKTLSPQASVTESGVVQLVNNTDSDRQDVATTPKAVNAAIRKPATLTSVGTVKLTNSIDADNQQDAVTPKGVFDALKTIPQASLDAKGIVQLSNAIDSNSENSAASSAAVKVIADKLPKMAILYPNGTETTPYVLKVNTRLVIENPFPGHIVMCVAEIKFNDLWGDPKWLWAEGGQGVVATQLNDDSIVLQSGSHALSHAGNRIGTPLPITTTISSAPVRIKVWRIT